MVTDRAAMSQYATTTSLLLYHRRIVSSSSLAEEQGARPLLKRPSAERHNRSAHRNRYSR
jgi:hypothetical protein